MARRSLWHGAISFGLIHIPVDLFTAAREHSLQLHFLDSRDFEPVGYERINKATGKIVDWAHIVRGYEYSKNKYVALSDSDFRHANVKATETIDVDSFVAVGEISPVYFDSPYYLKAGKGGDKVYRLFASTLASSKRVAVANFVMRGRQHLCMITVNAGVLVLVTLRFHDQILPLEDFEQAPSARAAAPKASEVSMARRLVEEMTRDWKPQRFHDTYREDLMRRIREKIKHKQTHELGGDERAERARPKAEVIDLMEALKKSLKGNVPTRAPRKAARARRRA